MVNLYANLLNNLKNVHFVLLIICTIKILIKIYKHVKSNNFIGISANSYK